MSPLAGELLIATAVTAGTVVAPLTLWPVELLTMCVPKPSAAFVPAELRSVPPFSVSAVAATLMPSESASVASTSYSNVKVLVVLPLA